MRPAFLSRILALLDGGANRTNAMSQTNKITNQEKTDTCVPVLWASSSGWNVPVRVIKREVATFWLPDAGPAARLTKSTEPLTAILTVNPKPSIAYESRTYR
jgi:hypothetical protein